MHSDFDYFEKKERIAVDKGREYQYNLNRK
jgi:hypothetical protein